MKQAHNAVVDAAASAYTSLPQMLQTVCARYADQPAFSQLSTSLTFAEVDQLSREFAGFLQHELTLASGERIAIVLPNSVQLPLSVYGAWYAGLVVVMINPLCSLAELVHQVRDAQVSALVFSDLNSDVIEKLLTDQPVEHLILTGWDDFQPTHKRLLSQAVTRYFKRQSLAPPLCQLQPQPLPFLVALDQGYEHGFTAQVHQPQDLACIQYTLGTTGLAKGALLTHGAVLANMQQILQRLHEHTCDDFIAGEQRLMAVAPLCHMYAFMAQGICMLAQGNHSVLISDPYDTTELIRLLKRWRITGLLGTHTLFSHLLRQQDRLSTANFVLLKRTMCIGSRLSPTVAQRWQQLTGAPIIQAYGLTEAVAAVTMTRPSESVVGSVGAPLASTQVQIRDEQLQPLPSGEVGEICVQGPQVCYGYWNAPITSADSIQQGWLHTGDLGYLDEQGYLYIVDRKTNVIYVSGFAVYPAEIENVVCQHEKVSHAAAIGMHDALTGEAVKLMVVRADASLTPAELEVHCRANLAGYKVPKLIEFVDRLPLSPMGKIVHRQLREL